MPCIVLEDETRIIITIINLRKTTISPSIRVATLSPHDLVWLGWIAGKLFRRSRLANRITRKEREWRRADLATGSFAAGCLESPRSAAIFLRGSRVTGWLTPVVVFFHRVQAYREPIINCWMPLSSPWDKYVDEDGRQEVDLFSRIERKTSRYDTLSRTRRYSLILNYLDNLKFAKKVIDYLENNHNNCNH